MTGRARRLLVGALAWLSVSVVAIAQAPSDEYRLKAAFVYRFPQFVAWPAAALQNARTLDLCVLRPNPFGSDLEQLVNGETLDGRPLRVRVIGADDGVEGCQALFASARSDRASAVLKAADGHAILTIGETAEFLADGGIIALRLVDRRVRFEIDTANAQKAGLRISAQLLSLASAVRGGRR